MQHDDASPARAHALQSLTQLIRQPSTATLESALSALPAAQRESFTAWALRGELARRRSDFASAIAGLEAALAQAPEANAVRHCLALAQLQAGASDAGRDTLAEILRVDPHDPIARFQLAVSLERDGRAAEAMQQYEAQVAQHPAHVAAWRNLGLLRLAQRMPDRAAEAFAQVVGRDANDFNGWLSLGVALHEAGRRREAIDAWSRASALRPREIEPLRRAASALGELAELPPAVALLQRAITIAPADLDLRLACASHSSNLGLHRAALAHLREARRLAPDDPRVHSALLLELQYGGEPITADALAREHWHWGATHADTVPHVRRTQSRRKTAGGLRIGYLSPRFGIGPLAPLFLPVLEAHDRAQFEVHLFSATPASDAIGQRMREAAAAWHELPRDDGAAAALIAAEELDLLIDLAGHAPGHRLAVLARRPALVQATWLDYFDTTGMSAIDYLVGDPIETPVDEAAHFRERLVLLPCRFAFRPVDAVHATRLPATSRGYVTFGSFNRHAKLSDATLDCWAAVLDSVPHSRLALRAAAYKGASTVAWLKQEWARRVPVERIDFLPWLPWNEALAAYADIDVALDPFPYNGGVTTCDALVHGVPVVALAGDRMIARQSAALLHAAGRPEWIAQDRDEYVRIAAALASDPGLARLRADLYAQVRTSPLCDVPCFTQRLEQAYRKMVALGPSTADARTALQPIVIA